VQIRLGRCRIRHAPLQVQPVDFGIRRVAVPYAAPLIVTQAQARMSRHLRRDVLLDSLQVIGLPAVLLSP
jgi:hypothetical protein